MFEEFMGIPAHPLLVHAAVVFVPLLALLAVAYAVVPFVRPHTRWVLGLLALATPGATLLSKLSGDAFFQRLQDRNLVTAGFIPTIENHQNLGTWTLYTSIALAVLALALVLVVGPGGPPARLPGWASAPWVSIVLRVLTVVAAGVAMYYVIRTGDSGAQAAWIDS